MKVPHCLSKKKKKVWENNNDRNLYRYKLQKIIMIIQLDVMKIIMIIQLAIN